jgi:hypothetical protein
VAQRRLAAEENRLEVDVLHPVPGVDAGVLDQVILRRADACVVERDVHRTVSFGSGVEQYVDRHLI